MYIHKQMTSDKTELNLTDTLSKVWFLQSLLQQEFAILTHAGLEQHLYHAEEIIACATF